MRLYSLNEDASKLAVQEHAAHGSSPTDTVHVPE